MNTSRRSDHPHHSAVVTLPWLALALLLGSCSLAAPASTHPLSAKQILGLLEAQLWEVPDAALQQGSRWTVHVQHFERGNLTADTPYELKWKAGEWNSAGFLLRDVREGGVTRVLATSYEFGARQSSRTLDTKGIEVDTSLVNVTDTLSWDASAPRFQTMATYGLYRRHDKDDGTYRFDSIDWNEQTRNTAEFQALPSVVVVTLEKN